MKSNLGNRRLINDPITEINNEKEAATKIIKKKTPIEKRKAMVNNKVETNAALHPRRMLKAVLAVTTVNGSTGMLFMIQKFLPSREREIAEVYTVAKQNPWNPNNISSGRKPANPASDKKVITWSRTNSEAIPKITIITKPNPEFKAYKGTPRNLRNSFTTNAWNTALGS